MMRQHGISVHTIKMFNRVSNLSQAKTNAHAHSSLGYDHHVEDVLDMAEICADQRWLKAFLGELVPDCGRMVWSNLARVQRTLDIRDTVPVVLRVLDSPQSVVVWQSWLRRSALTPYFKLPADFMERIRRELRELAAETRPRPFAGASGTGILRCGSMVSYARSGDAQSLAKLLKGHPDLARGPEGAAALREAVNGHHMAAIDLLCRHGARV